MTNNSFRSFVEQADGMRRNVIERCAQCRFGIDINDEFVTVSDTGEKIHRSCWEEYATENAELFFEPDYT